MQLVRCDVEGCGETREIRNTGPMMGLGMTFVPPGWSQITTMVERRSEPDAALQFTRDLIDAQREALPDGVADQIGEVMDRKLAPTIEIHPVQFLVCDRHETPVSKQAAKACEVVPTFLGKSSAG